MSAISTFQVSQDFNQSSVSPTAIDTYTQECDQNVYLPILPTLFNQPQPQPQYYPENYLIHSFTTPQHLYYIQDCPFVEHNQPPLKNISIYASYIFANISNDYIHHVFSTIGAVKRIDIIDKINDRHIVIIMNDAYLAIHGGLMLRYFVSNDPYVLTNDEEILSIKNQLTNLSNLVKTLCDIHSTDIVGF